MVIAFLGLTEIDMAEVSLATLRPISNSIEDVFFYLLIPKLKPLSISIFYRPPNVNTFPETFINDLKLIDFKKAEVYFHGDFNINLHVNDKFVLEQNQSFDF